jgi:rubredoxin
LTEGTGNTLYFAVPGVALITFINLKAMRFCRECGAYNRRFGAFTSSNYCSKCGHSFDERGDV